MRSKDRLRIIPHLTLPQPTFQRPLALSFDSLFKMLFDVYFYAETAIQADTIGVAVNRRDRTDLRYLMGSGIQDVGNTPAVASSDLCPDGVGAGSGHLRFMKIGWCDRVLHMSIMIP